MRSSPAAALFYISIFLLPWVGVGVIKFLTGRDVGGGLQPSWIFLALALSVWALRRIRFQSFNDFVGEVKKLPLPLVLITSGAFLAVAVSGIGIFTAGSTESLATALGRWSRQLIQLLIMFAFVWWAALWVRGERRWQLTLDILFLGATFQLLYSLFQGVNFYTSLPGFSQLEFLFTSNPSILSGSERLYLNNVLLNTPRLRGTVCEPLYLGNFLLMAWPFLFVWKRPAWLRVVLGVFLAGLLALTWSRGAWLGFAGQCFLMVVFFLMKSGNKLKYLPFGAGGFLLLFPVIDFISGGLILQRMQAIFNNQDWSNLTRLYSMKAAWLAFLESPVVGVGWGQFAFHFPLLVDPMGLQSQFSWPVVNNFPLQILCETGLVGFLLFAAGTILLFKMAWSDLANFPSLISPGNRTFPAVLGVWGVWIQLLSFSQYNLPHIWIGLGLLMAAILENSEQISTAAAEENYDAP